MCTQASSGSGIGCTIIKLSPSLRGRPPTTIVCRDSPTSTYINFKDGVLPLLKDRENNITIYHSPIGFKNAKARDNYINYLKNIMGEVPEKERQGLKELMIA